MNEQGQAALKNLSARLTTFVNGQAVDACVLRDGDRIEMGSGQTIQFVFRVDPRTGGGRRSVSVRGGPEPARFWSREQVMVKSRRLTQG